MGRLWLAHAALSGLPLIPLFFPVSRNPDNEKPGLCRACSILGSSPAQNLTPAATRAVLIEMFGR